MSDKVATAEKGDAKIDEQAKPATGDGKRTASSGTLRAERVGTSITVRREGTEDALSLEALSIQDARAVSSMLNALAKDK